MRPHTRSLLADPDRDSAWVGYGGVAHHRTLKNAGSKVCGWVLVVMRRSWVDWGGRASTKGVVCFL